MSRLALIAACGALCACLGLGGLAWWQSGRIDRLAAERDALAVQVRQLAARAELEAVARAAAQAEAKRQRARAQDFDAVRDLIREGVTDAPIPDDLRRVLDRLGLQPPPGRGAAGGAPGGR
jgi:outer membrane murein-binding lipoprotein Lpp